MVCRCAAEPFWLSDKSQVLESLVFPATIMSTLVDAGFGRRGPVRFAAGDHGREHKVRYPSFDRGRDRWTNGLVALFTITASTSVLQ